jgi:hypothetical protein
MIEAPPEPRSPTTFEPVREGLSLLTWTFVASAVLTAGSLARLTMDRAALSPVWSGMRLGFLATSVLIAIGASRLRRLPPAVRFEQAGDPYRGAAARVEEPRLAGLSRAFFAAAFATAALYCFTLLWHDFAPRSFGAQRLFDKGLWLAQLAAQLAATVLLALWSLRLARDLRLRLPAALPIGIVAVELAREGFAVWRTVGEQTSSPWVWTVHGVAALAAACGFAALTRLVDRELAAMPAEATDDPVSSAEPGRRFDAGDAARWATAASGLGRYAGALKARLVSVVVSVVLLLAIPLSGSMMTVVVVVPIISALSLIIGVVMVLGLAAYARQPEAAGARVTAQAAFALFALATAADLEALASMGGAILGFGRTSGVSGVSGAGVASQVLSLVGLLVLLASFRRLAAFLVHPPLGARALSLAKLVGWLLGGLVAIGACIALSGAFVVLVVILLVLFVIGAITAVVRLLGLTADLRAHMEEWQSDSSPPRDEARGSARRRRA